MNVVYSVQEHVQKHYRAWRDFDSSQMSMKKVNR